MENLETLKKESAEREIHLIENKIRRVLSGEQPANISTTTGKSYIGETVVNFDEVKKALSDAGYNYTTEGNCFYINIE